jgi:hypothetical protein
MIVFIDVMVVPMSFLVFCFVNDNSTSVDHNLCLYICLFFPEKYVFFVVLFLDFGICCSVQSTKAMNL